MATGILCSTSSLYRDTRKYAVVIGINYENRSLAGPLRGPRRGARAFRDLLLRRYNFQNEDVVLMDERSAQSDLIPTRTNIIRQLRDLVNKHKGCALLVLYYAGHVGQQFYEDGHEVDGLDEAIIPLDYDGTEESLIKDNLLREILVDGLPNGTPLRVFLDACHSGTLLDLKHDRCNRQRYLAATQHYHPKRTHGFRVAIRSKDEVQPSIMDWVPERRGRHLIGSFSSSRPPAMAGTADETNMRQSEGTSFNRAISEFAESFLTERCSSPSPESLKVTICSGDCVFDTSEATTKDVISLSACSDAQVNLEDPHGNSMTQMLVQFLDDNPQPTYEELWKHMSNNLDESLHGLRNLCRKHHHANLPGYQDPQLASEVPLDLKSRLIL